MLQKHISGKISGNKKSIEFKHCVSSSVSLVVEDISNYSHQKQTHKV